MPMFPFFVGAVEWHQADSEGQQAQYCCIILLLDQPCLADSRMHCIAADRKGHEPNAASQANCLRSCSIRHLHLERKEPARQADSCTDQSPNEALHTLLQNRRSIQCGKPANEEDSDQYPHTLREVVCVGGELGQNEE
mmetsp:Transcript_27617/g.36941  ORF Transcript_27617/g.36941 Transcript_27617/m.36941 type:complete len:138 (-) Transcript_27617:143-556(-)